MPQNLVDRQVYQVPVVGLLCVLQVERDYLVALLNSLLVTLQPLCGQSLKLVNKNQEPT